MVGKNAHKGYLTIDGQKIRYDSGIERSLMERYYPLIQRNKTRFNLYLPRKSYSTNVINPVKVGGKVLTEEMLLALRTMRLYQWMPDFQTLNGILIEVKGMMENKFPTLVKTFRHQHPVQFSNYRIVFQNYKLKVPNRKMNYGEWATNLGIKWAPLITPESMSPSIPNEWLTDIPIDTYEHVSFDDWVDEEFDDEF